MTKDDYYLDIALAVSKRSTCLKRRYGCVIVHKDVIVATGYNGSPRGAENCVDRGKCKREGAERYSDYENCDAVHAEQNALIAVDRDKLIGSTVYLACEHKPSSDWVEERFVKWLEDDNPVPCNLCNRMLRNAGIAKVMNRRGEVCLL